MPSPAQLLTKPAELNQDITNFLLERRKEGRASETIRSRIQTLKQIARTVDINNPEKVKDYIANSTWSNSTKSKFIDTYSAYL